MVLSEDSNDHLFKKHQELSTKLNLDINTITQAWQSFQTIQTNYSLEGEALHWLGCAVFVACRKTTTPTVSRSTVEGNCVSLTSLLRHCNLSLTQFFNKITKWADMANLSEDFRQKIKRLEGNFAVSYNIFKKFTPIFNEIFKGPIDMDLRSSRNRKTKAPLCTPTKVFEFCWTLFTTVKGQNPLYSEDIVMSYHLLQACCDLAFRNAFLDNRKDLLNPSFPELPPNWSDPNYIAPKEAPCIINYLCSKHDGIAAEVKYVKEYSWKEHIKDLFSKDILQGDEDTFTGFFDPANFDSNLRNITKTYEAQLLNRGDFDERIFLAEYRRRLLLKEQALKNANGSVFSPMSYSGDALVTESSRSGENSLPGTPGSAKKVNPRTQMDSTPLSTATKSVARLQSLLAGRQSGPSELLLQILQGCKIDPTEKIATIIESLGDKFRTEFTRQSSSVPMITPDYANQRLQLAITLFYKFVENIFQKEKTLHSDISHLAVQEIFYECTLACSLEIIIYSYNCQRKFPWILNALNVEPFYFVRVIELIVRSQDQLPRDAVKHLNMVEQKIIESLIWKSGSPIWRILSNSGENFPKFEDIALPGNMVHSEEQPAPGQILRRSLNNQLQSPGPSAVERFQSPISDVKKQLFKPSQTPTKTSHAVMVDKDGTKQLIVLEKPIDSTSTTPVKAEGSSPSSGRPKKSGSLSIIIRKFYNLAYSRMKQLCNKLDITDLKFTQKIWTVFEYSIRDHTHLIKDRHLDQLLMCAVYVVCKVTSTREQKFAEIMQHYRGQPQASSHIYRNVLIDRSSTQEVTDEAIKSFALQFKEQDPNIALSPLPLINNNFASPRCQITDNLYITSYDTPTNGGSKTNSLEYHFSRSPSKDLEKINNAINKHIVGKRLLGYDEDTYTPNNKVQRKMQSLVEQRRSQVTE
ncbi:retinoblastoma-like protein 2 isoform X2 [Photinus pyralis]|uniref:Retinoblastoma-associated protein A-box domain-containing protein n=3 Tax=Photinus pyralis TaxID=7054 RepID=A0A1Y1LDR3_PHOPY|nr:retinoblastoma-like protein 2 isoform X2 [Photinus pyralis]XP_031348716.1 retinoblastoma-like protein 2 isoform X2 [Photinus pyralis]